MSFTLGKTRMIDTWLFQANSAGISLVAGAGNHRYNLNAYPATHPWVISVGATNNAYTPWQNQNGSEGSNYGEGVIALWAPGQRVPLTNKAGNEYFSTGTSSAAPYVSGILALFCRAEGTSMTPDLAKTRLMAQTEIWVNLPSDGTDWHNTPTAFANTGNRKGAAQDPPVQYIGGPQAAAVTSSAPATTSAVSPITSDVPAITSALATSSAASATESALATSSAAQVTNSRLRLALPGRL